MTDEAAAPVETPVAPAEGEAQTKVEQPQTSEPLNEAETGAAQTEEETTEKPETEEQRRSKFQRRLDRQKAARIEAETRARIAEERLSRLEAQQTQPQPQSNGKPLISQFETADEYATAMEKWAESKANETAKQREEREAQEKFQRQRSQSLSEFQERVEDAREKYADYDTVAGGNHPVTQIMADAITDIEEGPEVAYYLGKHPSEASRIAQLSPLRQVAEIGKLVAKIAAQPATVKPSAAPEPIRPVTAAGKSRVIDTTDPRSVKDMSTSEWIEAERARQKKRLQGAVR